MAFNRNVFINCPFDDGYRPLLCPLLFTVYRLGFQPRIALESRDSGRPRIDKIIELIRESQYAIHDLSRIQAALSDIAGSDIQTHGGKPERVVREVRNWLNSHSGKHAAGPTKIWTDFHTFTEDTHNALISQGHSEEDLKYLEIDELMARMAAWFTPDSKAIAPTHLREFPIRRKK